MQNWTPETDRTLPIQFVVGEVRALKGHLVVTKVMYCDDLLATVGEPSQPGIER